MKNAVQKKSSSVEERLGVNETRPDKTSHLEITGPERCADCKKPCIVVCPAGTYAFSDEKGVILISFENCLECGACRAVCPYGAILWKHPLGGSGVCYRYG